MNGTMKLKGGPFDGAVMPRPRWRWQTYLVGDHDDDKVVHRYRPTRDPGVWRYDGPDHVVLATPSQVGLEANDDDD